MLPAKLMQRLRQHVALHAGDHADPDAARHFHHRAGAKHLQPVGEVAHRAHYLMGKGRWRHHAGGAVEQRLAEILLQLLDLQAHRARAAAHDAGRSGEAALFEDGAQRDQHREIHEKSSQLIFVYLALLILWRA
jgi:hypothetical protein